jgi:hypothetical protein
MTWVVTECIKVIIYSRQQIQPNLVTRSLKLLSWKNVLPNVNVTCEEEEHCFEIFIMFHRLTSAHMNQVPYLLPREADD